MAFGTSTPSAGSPYWQEVSGRSARRSLRPPAWILQFFALVTLIGASFAMGWQLGTTASTDAPDVAFPIVPHERQDVQIDHRLALESYVESGVLDQAALDLFASFDTNGNHALDVAEGEAFFQWVEERIQYRYDDEDAVPERESIVGDGRPGSDYLQTPKETLAESSGDCDDQNALEVAFYWYWQVPTYFAYVNAKEARLADHAVALVKLPADVDAWMESSDMVVYQLRASLGIEEGLYMIVDNAASSEFGRVEGLEPGGFQLFGVRSLDSLYAAQPTLAAAL